jgi:hypothetical protein
LRKQLRLLFNLRLDLELHFSSHLNALPPKNLGMSSMLTNDQQIITPNKRDFPTAFYNVRNQLNEVMKASDEQKDVLYLQAKLK